MGASISPLVSLMQYAAVMSANGQGMLLRVRGGAKHRGAICIQRCLQQYQAAMQLSTSPRNAWRNLTYLQLRREAWSQLRHTGVTLIMLAAVDMSQATQPWLGHRGVVKCQLHRLDSESAPGR